jgi:hypothetical protein
MNARTCQWLAWTAAGLAAGATVTLLPLVLTGAAGAHRAAPRAAAAREGLEAVHLPPLLTVAGEKVELRYDIYCPASLESEAPCDAGGTVYIRTGESGPFRAVPLQVDPRAQEGRYVAPIPADIVASPAGFSYYAVLRGSPDGASTTDPASTTLPAGGASAPQRSLGMASPVPVSLGVHPFGAVERRDARVASAAWGSGPGRAGLEDRPEATPIGGSAFDVDESGTVSVLDEANRRVLRFRRGGDGSLAVPLPISGRIADLSVDADGTMYVLEFSGAGAPLPVLRAFDAAGHLKEAVTLAERTASQLRLGPRGPVVLQYPSTEWLPVEAHGSPLATAAQQTEGRSARSLRGGAQVIVMRHGVSEVRAALVAPTGAVRSWRIQSATPIAEVQLAQPLGSRLVLVFRVYTDTQDQFEALVLGDAGIEQRLALASSDWAETAPLARFRLVGSSLYQLGSTPSGLFVDRYDLEVS